MLSGLVFLMKWSFDYPSLSPDLERKPQLNIEPIYLLLTIQIQMIRYFQIALASLNNGKLSKITENMKQC